MISIIIITLNEEDYLPRLLNALARQTYQDFEVIVSDSNSADNTRKAALAFRKKFKQFTFFIHRFRSVSAARNEGAKRASGRWLLFFDADTLVKPDFVEAFAREMGKRKLACAGVYIWPDSRNPIDWAYYSLLNALLWAFQWVSPLAVGSCMASTRSAHRRIGGFDREVVLAEDFDYSRRSRKAGSYRMLPLSVNVSVRRFEKEGRLKLGVKYVCAFLYRLFRGEIGKNRFTYRFGEYGPKKKKKKKKKKT